MIQQGGFAYASFDEKGKQTAFNNIYLRPFENCVRICTFSGFYAILGWLFAIAGIFVAGYPYLLRDALRKSANNNIVKYSLSSSLLFLSIMIALAIFITPNP